MVIERDDEHNQIEALRAENERLNALFQQQLQQNQNQLQENHVIPQPVENQVNQVPAQIHRVAVKLPPFWSDKPNLWFSQADSQFIISGITNEVTKFHYVVSQLDTRIAAEVEDVIISPPEESPYTYLRNKIIERLSASEEQRVRQLISEEELGDRKPSQFLRHLRSIAGTIQVQNNLLRQFWLQRLPVNVRSILTGHLDLTLDQLSELADKIFEIAPTQPPFSVHAASVEKGNVDNSINNAIEALTKQISELSTKFHERSRSRNHSPSLSRFSRESSKSAISSRAYSPDLNRWCWYHSEFKDKAKKCIQPCSYNKKNYTSGL